jgi:hypothetical protein
VRDDCVVVVVVVCVCVWGGVPVAGYMLKSVTALSGKQTNKKLNSVHITTIAPFFYSYFLPAGVVPGATYRFDTCTLSSFDTVLTVYQIGS